MRRKSAVQIHWISASMMAVSPKVTRSELKVLAEEREARQGHRFSIKTSRRDRAHARRGEFLRPDDDPLAILVLLHLVEIGAVDVVERPVPTQPADDGVHRVFLQRLGD